MNNLFILAAVGAAIWALRHWKPPDDWNDHDDA